VLISKDTTVPPPVPAAGRGGGVDPDRHRPDDHRRAINLSVPPRLRDRVHDHLREIVQRHADTIDTFVSDRLSDIRVVTRAQPRERLEDAEFLQQLLNVLREEYHGTFVDIGLVNAEGIQVAYAGPFNLTGVDYSSAPWFEEARSREHYVSDVFAGLRGTPHFIVAAARSQGSERYLVKATIDFEAFNDLVGNIRIGATGFAFIFNLDGEFQTKPRFEVALGRRPYSELLAEGLSRDRVWISEGTDLLQRPTIVALAPLHQARWFLGYQQQQEDAFSELWRLEMSALTVFVIAAVCALVISYLLASQVALQLAEVTASRPSGDN
jgi:two-component system NtrC family sensor kinase